MSDIPLTFNLNDPIIITEFPYISEQEEFLVELETTDKPQGIGFLEVIGFCTDNIKENSKSKIGFCCLGLIYELNKISKVLDRSDKKLVSSYTSDGYNPNIIRENRTLTYPLIKKYKLRSFSGLFSKQIRIYKHNSLLYDANYLVDLNDEARLSFKEIARFIRQFPHLVFTNLDKK